MSELPSPLVPPEVDLRGLPWMRLDTGRLLDSDLFALSNGYEFKAAVALWCKSWTQIPAASLPVDDRILAHLSGAGTGWKKLKAMALRGWVECSDGRLYHPVVAEQALMAWDERVAYRGKQEADAERKRNERIARDKMFEALKAYGIAPKWNTPTSELRDMLERVTDLSRVTGGDPSHGRDEDVRNLSPAKRGTGRDGTGEGSLKASLSFGAGEGSGESGLLVTDANGKPTPPLDDAQAIGIGVPAAKRLRAIGIRVTALDPTLLALCSEKFTVEEMALMAAEQVLRKAHLWNDAEVHPELPELLASAATQQQMLLTAAQYASIQTAAAEIGVAYIAKSLRGRRQDAIDNQSPVRSAKHGARKPSATDNFEGKTYVGTAIDKLSPELRAAFEPSQPSAG